MSTPRTASRARTIAQTTDANADVAKFMAEFGKQGTLSPGALTALQGLLTGYGDQSPLYDLQDVLGRPSKIINDLETPFESHADVAKALNESEAAFTVSEFDGRDVYSLAVKSSGAIYYFSLLHDKDRNPQVAGTLLLTQSVVNRDFAVELNGVKTVILQKGQTVFKALPAEYAMKMKRA